MAKTVFYKDEPALQSAALAPDHPISTLPPAGAVLGRLARTYNAVGGLVEVVASKAGIDPVAVLCVWYVESGGGAYTPGSPILRFEAHKFFKYWGAAHADVFDAHFKFGGRAGVVGKPSQNHRFRKGQNEAWRRFHGDQGEEREVWSFAGELAGAEEPASLSASWGGPQIMGFNHDGCGYSSAHALREAFGKDQRWQVLGFFDFCRTQGCMADIQLRHWTDFGARYNGDGATYGGRLKEAYAARDAFLALPRH